MHQFRAGDTVTVRGSFGRELPRRVTILSVGEEAGREVIDYIDPDTGRICWAYVYQVEAEVPVEERAA